jgi:hypothetical protein
MSWAVASQTSEVNPILWKDLSREVQDALAGRLAGLWGHATDEEVFSACSVAKQQTLLIMASRLQAKELWHLIQKVINVWGEHGVGIDFSPAERVDAMLRARKDFTTFMANHKGTTGGFYEKGRSDAILHFIYTDGTPQKWGVHFDLYSPVHSPLSVFKHLRHEFIGNLFPDWRMVQERLGA